MENQVAETKTTLTQELLLLVITIAPAVYLLSIWNLLPEQIPLHWNFQGEIDRYGDKSSLWTLFLVVQIPVYFLLMFLPKLAAKGKNIKMMGKKYYRLRVIVQLFMSAIMMSIMLGSSGMTSVRIEVMLGVCFAIFMILFGNYMGSIRQNHFVGIRTPWTLESEEVWKKTHHIAGRLWVGGGFIGLILLAFLPGKWGLMTIVGLMLVPSLAVVVYSYFLFQKIEKA